LSGVAKVLSTATTVPGRRGAAHTASRSATSSSGFEGDSNQTRSQFAQASIQPAVSAPATRRNDQRPLDFGATVALQSATKLIGGHSDLLAGVAVTRDEALWAQLRHTRELAGATPGTLECFLALRGARTMALRLAQAQRSAQELAARLERHPRVARVRYPGLVSHPTHAVARRVLKGFGSVISFDLHGDAARADAVCRSTRLIVHATSLGGVESTMERRAAIPGQQHLPPTLLRLSVGIEDVEDLWRDLAQTLAAEPEQP
jgi:cystathionine gamma-synthase